MPYGYEDDPYAAQVMLREYHPQSGSYGSPSYLGDYLGEADKIPFWQRVTGFFESEQGQQIQQGIQQQLQAGGADPCVKPIDFFLWSKSRKAEWQRRCDAELARRARAAGGGTQQQQFVSSGTPMWVWGLGALAVGTAAFFAYRRFA
jgi:hypothetical protein